ncbi:uncharacterized protein EI90DRAFT_2626360 [Cantharellus anzutake]|uniref:uncharacterized protein n=1 Tax=Cantharellus anzutake TaxID=1750568 RepID=UPI00190320E5|nr:uncharacterized protein EI90DRAFT_2626360 [Cantharellus anzutake]KAF8319851.1 hypothetical protein EI90DRAFT_2626360 [Cantharellus anzutake]
MAPKAKKKPADDGGTTEPSLAERLSFLDYPRPFKNPSWSSSRQGAANKRGRGLKQILASDREREKFYRERAQLAPEVDGEVPKSREEDVVFYHTVEAPPSILPQGKYCDITGLEGPYTHPTSGLRYHDQSVYEVVKSLNPSAQQAYLAARGASNIVK